MIVLSVNSLLPKIILNLLKNKEKKEDENFVFAVTKDPITLFIVLKSISNTVISKMNSSFIVGSVVIDNIPFLTLDYGSGLVFEFPIFSLENFDSNIINIVIVKKNDNMVLNIRAIFLNHDVLSNLHEGVRNVDTGAHKRIDNLYELLETYQICTHIDNISQKITNVEH